MKNNTAAAAAEIAHLVTTENRTAYQAKTDQLLFVEELLDLAGMDWKRSHRAALEDALANPPQKNPAAKLYVEILFSSHTYTATITRPGQLSRFLSTKRESFRIGSISGPGAYPAGFAQELNSISRFSHHAGRAASAR